MNSLWFQSGFRPPHLHSPLQKPRTCFVYSFPSRKFAPQVVKASGPTTPGPLPADTRTQHTAQRSPQPVSPASPPALCAFTSPKRWRPWRRCNPCPSMLVAEAGTGDTQEKKKQLRWLQHDEHEEGDGPKGGAVGGSHDGRRTDDPAPGRQPPGRRPRARVLTAE